MDVTIIDKKRNRSVSSCDVDSLQQNGKELIVKDLNGWTARIRIPDGCEVTVSLEGEV